MKLGTLVRIGDVSRADAAFAELTACGFTACQLVYKPETYTKEAAQSIRLAADKAGIDISAMFAGYRDTATVWDIYDGYRTAGINVLPYADERVAYVLNAAEFAAWAGIEDVIIHAGFVPNDPFCDGYTRMVENVRKIALVLKERGQNLLFETGGEAPVTLKRLIEDVGTGNLYINFDPANILMYGLGNPVDALRVFGKYVRNCHGKDGLLPEDTRHLGKEVPLGEGLADFPAIIGMFRDLGYDRYIIIEREITGEQQKADILEAKKRLETLLKGE